MRVTVVGASGEFGTAVSDRLEAAGVEVTRAHRATGVDAVTGQGLAAACDGADVIVDATSLVSRKASESKEFFEAVARNISLVADESGSAVVFLTIYGADDPAVNAKMGHYQGKAAQERTYVEHLGDRVTALRSVQWFSLAETFLDMLTFGPVGFALHMRAKPAAVEDVADVAVRVIRDPLRPAAVTVAGPAVMDMADAAKAIAAKRGRPSRVFGFRFGGAALRDGGLVPDAPDVTTGTTFDEWLARRP